MPCILLPPPPPLRKSKNQKASAVDFQEGAICLHSAAMRGHVAVIKALLQKGAAVDAKTKVRINCLNIKMFYALALAKPCPPPPPTHPLLHVCKKYFVLAQRDTMFPLPLRVHKNVLYWHTQNQLSLYRCSVLAVAAPFPTHLSMSIKMFCIGTKE